MVRIEQNEKSTLMEIVRNNKFPEFNKINFPDNAKEALTYFTKCIKMLNLILINLESNDKDKKLIGKIRKLLNEGLFLNSQAQDLILKKQIESMIDYDIRENKINTFYIDNQEKIDGIIFFVYNLGNIVKQFDTETHGGIY